MPWYLLMAVIVGGGWLLSVLGVTAVVGAHGVAAFRARRRRAREARAFGVLPLPSGLSVGDEAQSWLRSLNRR